MVYKKAVNEVALKVVKMADSLDEYLVWIQAALKAVSKVSKKVL